MELITKAVLVNKKDLGKIEIFSIEVTEKNYLKVKKRLELEKIRIINIFKKMYEENIIRSIYQPKNKKVQKTLNDLVNAKRIIKKSIQDINNYF